MKRIVSLGWILVLGLTTVNPVEGTWTRKADMPMARTCCGAAAVNGKIYVFGGGRSWYESNPPAAIYMYDPATDTWEIKADMPTPRLTSEAVAIDGKIYAIGGQRSSTALRTLEVYDPATDTWEKKADMQTARAWLGAAAVNGKIYAVGGWPSMASVEMYDPVTDTWTKKADMPAGRHVFGISAVNGQIYVIGGEGGASTPSPNVFEHNPTTDRWTEKADMPTGRYCQSTGVVNGRIYVFGGDSVHGGGGPGLSVVEVYDPVMNSWSKGADMLSPRTETCAAAVNGRIYLIGGSTRSGGPPLSLVEEYTPPVVVDFNSDGIVDCADICMMVDYWGTNESLYDVAPHPSGDGIVDAQDLLLLSDHLFEESYPFELRAYWKLDETEGILAHNSVGDNDGLLLGDPIWLPAGGKVRGALQLDGLDDYIQTSFVLNPAGGALSAFAWVKGGAPGQAIISQANGTGTGETWLGIDASNGGLMTGLVPPPVGRSKPEPLRSQSVITDAQWHHVGIVWDATFRSLYVDGTEVARDTHAMTAPLKHSDGGLYFGAGSTLAPETFFSGLIDDVRIYNAAISADAIAALAP